MKKITLLLILLQLSFAVFAQSESTENLRPKTSGTIVQHAYYEFEYSEEHEQARWVYYVLRPENSNGIGKRRNNFKSDPKVASGSASPDDYKGSGYDRGHICPAASMSITQEAIDQSFYMSNMSPQEPGFNRGKWKQLEAQVRSWTIIEKQLHVVSGPIFESNKGSIGENGVTIPGYYYKVIYDPTDEKKMIAFIMPNQKLSNGIENYVVTVDEVESRTGIDFFAALPDDIENTLESTKSTWEFVVVKSDKSSEEGNGAALQCKGITKSGKRCKRKTKNKNQYCQQHQNQAP